MRRGKGDIKQSVTVNIHDKKKKKKRTKKRVIKRNEIIRPTVPAIGGGANPFQMLSANPFQQSVSNMMTNMQQGINNNVSNAMSQMRLETQLMQDKIMALQYEQQKAIERKDELKSAEIEKKIEDLSKKNEQQMNLMKGISSSVARTMDVLLQKQQPVYTTAQVVSREPEKEAIAEIEQQREALSDPTTIEIEDILPYELFESKGKEPIIEKFQEEVPEEGEPSTKPIVKEEKKRVAPVQQHMRKTLEELSKQKHTRSVTKKTGSVMHTPPKK